MTAGRGLLCAALVPAVLGAAGAAAAVPTRTPVCGSAVQTGVIRVDSLDLQYRPRP